MKGTDMAKKKAAPSRTEQSILDREQRSRDARKAAVEPAKEETTTK